VGRLPANAAAQVVTIDPEQPQRVYAAVAAGVFRSDDGGQTWQSAVQGLGEGAVAALALDPRQPQHLYAATPAGALYASEDGASTWRPLADARTRAGS
jgi:photosystem II stability/assembly factor-like uncharacterized protein